MIIESVSYLWFLFKGLCQLGTHMNIGDVTSLKKDSKKWKFVIQFCYHFLGHFTFQIKDLTQPYTIDKGPDILINFWLEQLIKSGRTQSIDKILHCSFICRHSKCEIEIDWHIGIIFCWAVCNWCTVIDDGFCDHAGYSSVTAVAPMSTWPHDSCALPTFLLEDS